jgi:amino acid transporter
MKLLKFLAFLFILAIAAGGCQINIGSNVMTIYPGAHVASATQDIEADISISPPASEPSPVQGQGGGFGALLFGLVALVVAYVCIKVWQRGNPSDYIGDEKWK